MNIQSSNLTSPFVTTMVQFGISSALTITHRSCSIPHSSTITRLHTASQNIPSQESVTIATTVFSSAKIRERRLGASWEGDDSIHRIREQKAHNRCKTKDIIIIIILELFVKMYNQHAFDLFKVKLLLL